MDLKEYLQTVSGRCARHLQETANPREIKALTDLRIAVEQAAVVLGERDRVADKAARQPLIDGLVAARKRHLGLKD